MTKQEILSTDASSLVEIEIDRVRREGIVPDEYTEAVRSPRKPKWLKLRDVKAKAKEGDKEANRLLYGAVVPSPRYECVDWEEPIKEHIVAKYQEAGLVPKTIRYKTREPLINFLLSVETGVRHSAFLAIRADKAHWNEAGLSFAVVKHFRTAMVDLGFVIEAREQIARLPTRFQPTQKLKEFIESAPDSEADKGRIRGTKPKPRITIDKRPFDDGGYEDTHAYFDFLEQEQDRVTGLDDLSMTRQFKTINGHLWFGRFFGEVTQLSSELRKERITIDGEPIVEVDLPNSTLRLDYLNRGLPVPEGDLYQLSLLKQFPRDFVKAVVTRLYGRAVNGDGFPKRCPAGLGAILEGSGIRRESGWWFRFRDTLLETHEPLQHLEPHTLSRLWFIESEIMLGTANWLRRERNEISFIVHDALWVRESIEDEVKEKLFALRDGFGAFYPIGR